MSLNIRNGETPVFVCLCRLVSSRLALPCLAFSCLVLYCFVPFCFVLFRSVLFCFVFKSNWSNEDIKTYNGYPDNPSMSCSLLAASSLLRRLCIYMSEVCRKRSMDPAVMCPVCVCLTYTSSLVSNSLEGGGEGHCSNSLRFVVGSTVQDNGGFKVYLCLQVCL